MKCLVVNDSVSRLTVCCKSFVVGFLNEIIIAIKPNLTGCDFLQNRFTRDTRKLLTMAELQAQKGTLGTRNILLVSSGISLADKQNGEQEICKFT